ncbi:MAG: hypothetical protein OXC98_01570 [bacterium]|nr:hypothetical protein [Acidimicrobiia bacterium]MCY4649045.1 hypothetical protein [bacterium]
MAGVKKQRRRYAVGWLGLAVFLIVAEEAADIEFLGEALLGLVCIVLIATSVGESPRAATEVPAEDADAARMMGTPSL